MKSKIILGLCIFTIAGCNDDFLQEEPQDTLFANTLFVNRDGLQQGLNALYSLAREERSEISSYERSAAWKVGTDVAWGNYTFSRLRAVDLYGTNLNPADSVLDGIFNWLYEIVVSANQIIARAESGTVDFQGADDAENLATQNLMVAQARLLRAWAYRHLTNSWGDVPLNVQEIDGNNFRTFWERSDINTVQEQMIADLMFAEEFLPDNYNDPLVLSNVVAKHYLAELYLTRGENALAEQKAEEVIANPNFALITERFGVNLSEPGVAYMDQFDEGNSLPSGGNTETLWTFLNAPDQPGSARTAMRRTWVNRYFNLTLDDIWAFAEYGGRGIGRTMHTIYVEELFEDDDDRFSRFAFSKFYLTEEAGDTIFTRVPSFEDWRTSDPSWPGTKKWDSFPDLARVNAAEQTNSMPYLRLAETYLIAAEAEFNQGKNGEAADHINAVRVRSNATPITSADVTQDYILDERARELFSEEHRRYTLNRMGRLVERALQHNKFTQITERDILFPIPQNFIDSNDGVTEQNPGY